jgi:hypothetical protein
MEHFLKPKEKNTFQNTLTNSIALYVDISPLIDKFSTFLAKWGIKWIALYVDISFPLTIDEVTILMSSRFKHLNRNNFFFPFYCDVM